MTSETLTELDAPRCSMGAPLPIVVANDYAMRFAYLVERPGWDGLTIRSMSPDNAHERIAIIRPRNCLIHAFGAPNEESILGHRLADKGVAEFAASEVLNSEWITSLEVMNRVQMHHKRDHYSDYRHFIFAFHDSTLEFVATEFEVELTVGSLRQVARRLVDELP